jgi:hypothetical protein
LKEAAEAVGVRRREEGDEEVERARARKQRDQSEGEGKGGLERQKKESETESRRKLADGRNVPADEQKEEPGEAEAHFKGGRGPDKGGSRQATNRGNESSGAEGGEMFAHSQALAAETQRASSAAREALASTRQRGHVMTAEEHEQLIDLMWQLLGLVQNEQQSQATNQRLNELEQAMQGALNNRSAR